MKIKVYFYSSLLSITLLGCKHNETASIQVEKQSISFGEIKQNQSVTKTFRIKNVSDVPFKITQIGTNCGCTSAILSDSIIEKNQFAIIKTEYKPKATDTGYVKNKIVVEANTYPTYTVLYLDGEVKK